MDDPEIPILPISAKETPNNGRKVNSRLPKLPFLWGVSAPSGSGKTVMVLNLLLQKGALAGVFENVYIINPSIFSDPQWQPVINELAPEAMFEAYSEQTFDLLKTQFKKNHDRGEHTLLILDDCAGQEELTRQDMRSSFLKYTLRARLQNVSIIFCTQAAKLIPKKMRANMTAWTFFHAPNKNEIKELTDIINSSASSSQLAGMLGYATAEPYGFLQANKDRATGHWRYSKKFSEILNPSDY